MYPVVMSSKKLGRWRRRGGIAVSDFVQKLLKARKVFFWVHRMAKESVVELSGSSRLRFL